MATRKTFSGSGRLSSSSFNKCVDTLRTIFEIAREYGVAKARGYDLRTMSPFFHSASFVLRLLVLCFFS